MILSLWPVVASGFASVVIGWIWYSPYVFGGTWMRLSGVSPEMAQAGKKRMPVAVFLSFLAGMLIAWVMSFVGFALNEFIDWIGAVELGVWCWLGFVAPTLLGGVLWGRNPFRVYLIDAFYWLVTLVVMSLILLSSMTIFSGGVYSSSTDTTTQFAE